MELKIWVDGMPRIVCGVSSSTTTHEVIVAVAQASRKTGRYRMVLRRASHPEQDQILQPGDRPLTSLQRFALSSGPVRLILTCTGNEDPPSTPQPKSRFRHRTQDKRRHSINSKFSVEIGAIEEVYLLRIIDEHANDIVQQSGSLERLDKDIEEFELTASALVEIDVLRRSHVDTKTRLADVAVETLRLTSAIDAASRCEVADEFADFTDAEIAVEIDKLRAILSDTERRANKTQREIDDARLQSKALSESRGLKLDDSKSTSS